MTAQQGNIVNNERSLSYIFFSKFEVYFDWSETGFCFFYNRSAMHPNQDILKLFNWNIY